MTHRIRKVGGGNGGKVAARAPGEEALPPIRRSTGQNVNKRI